MTLARRAAAPRPAWFAPALIALAFITLEIIAPGARAADAPVVADTIAQRVAACTPCHGAQGRSIGGAYFPRIAGKPAGYLFNQLVNFREGRRGDSTMTWMVRNLPDAYLREIANHFAAQHPSLPASPQPQVSAATLERGRLLALSGSRSREVPACVQCHGRTLTGMLPAVPGLAGLPRDYLNAQFGAWRNATRSTGAPDCMAQIAKRLEPDDISAVTAWIASQPLPPDDAPELMPLQGLPMQCAAAIAPTPPPTSEPATLTTAAHRGRELALTGNCAGCHTAPGGAPYAGTRAIDTPFGVFRAPNITPDPETGIGRWSAGDLRRALHEGLSRDGSPLYPACPYPNFTRTTREDTDALFAFLRSVAPVRQPRLAHELHFPYDQRALLRAWRALYFDAGRYRPDPTQSAQWNRGAYLVQGLGHCGACHTPRNRLGAARADADLAGGRFGAHGWYSPSLRSTGEAGPGDANAHDAVALLGSGVAPGAAATGPMGAVVFDSLQHLPRTDLQAIAHYLRSLPALANPAAQTPPMTASSGVIAQGERLYRKHCEDCHRAGGEGAPPAYPSLAGNRAVTMTDPGNTIRAVLQGGFAPGTAGNPRPYGMPPFAHTLGDADIAAVVSYLRSAWGHRAGPVSALDVNRLRTSAH